MSIMLTVCFLSCCYDYVLLLLFFGGRRTVCEIGGVGPISMFNMNSKHAIAINGSSKNNQIQVTVCFYHVVVVLFVPRAGAIML